MEWESRFFAGSGALRGLELDLGVDRYQFLLTGSFGDIFPNLALLNNFYSHYRTPLVVLIPEAYAYLALRFNYSFVKYQLITPELQFRIHGLLCSSARPFLRSPGYLFPLLPTLHPWVADFVLSERVTDYECKRQLLGLPIGANMELPALSESRMVEIRESLKLIDFEFGNSAILSFHANSNPPVPIETQCYLVEKLIAQKIQVVMNTAGNPMLLETYKKLFNDFQVKYFDLPCDAPIEVVNLAGNYIGGSHGLTAILATFPSTAKLTQVEHATAGPITNNNRQISPESLKIHRALKSDVINNINSVPGDLESLKRYCNHHNIFI
jgi:hypothetical protein